MSVCEASHAFIPEKILVFNKQSDKVAFYDSSSSIRRRQEYLKTYYYRNSAIYIVNSSVLSEGLIRDNSDYYVMPSIRSVDIDTIEDLEIANLLMPLSS